METEPFINPELLFDDVPEALEPLESGVAYTTCRDCTAVGGGVTTIPQPHAVYTNEFGKAVIQMNSVVLGGINGLNN
jgi:hypothetical protein